MRLIRTTRLELREFFDRQVPQYAILSHTWGEDEVTLQELTSPDRFAGLDRRLNKIKDFCQLARSNGFEWAWVDTCCIDKTSSAELSEAINSSECCRPD